MADTVSSAINPAYAAFNPSGAETLQGLANQQQARSALQMMSQQAQQNPVPQQDFNTGQPLSPAMQQMAQQRLAAMNQAAQAYPSAENVQQQAQMSSTPYFMQQMMQQMQKQQADIAKTGAEAQSLLVKPMDTPLAIINPKTGELKVHYPDGSVSGQLGNGMPFKSDPTQLDQNGQPIQGATQGGSYWSQTPDVRAAMTAQQTERLKAIQDADQAVTNSKVTRDQLLPTLNQMDVINKSGNLPSVLPEAQAEGSTLLQNFAGMSGDKAKAVNTWDQLNSGNFTKGIQSLFAQGAGIRMEKPIADAVGKQNNIPTAVPQETREQMLNQLRTSAYNNVIASQNRAALLRNPNAQTQQEIPLNFSGKIHSMQEVMQTAQKYKHDPQQVIQYIKSQGGVVAP